MKMLASPLRCLSSVSLILFINLSVYAAPITFNVDCAGITVGVVNITADTLPNNMKGISGTLDTTNKSASLSAAAQACGEHHFNWYQIVTADNEAPKDRAGNQLNPPYVDVPPNGYDAAFSPTWADNLPWYFDEYTPPQGTLNVVNSNLLSANTSNTILQFSDFPSGGNGLNLSFKTWLVSLNADSSFHSFHGGFSWDYSVSLDGTDNGVTNIALLGGGPVRAEYQDIIGNFATKISEPPAFVLISIGLMLMLSRRRRDVDYAS